MSIIGSGDGSAVTMKKTNAGVKNTGSTAQTDQGGKHTIVIVVIGIVHVRGMTDLMRL